MSTWAWVALGAAVIVGGVFILLVREFVVLARNQPPITTITRTMIISWPGRSLAIVGLILFIVGMFFAHFVWDAGLL